MIATFAGRTIVSAAGGKCGLVDGVNHCAIARLERQMHVGWVGLRIRRVYEVLINLKPVVA